MRTLVQPPPSTHCDLCGGELRLKLIEPADLDLKNEIFVCANCGRELSCIVIRDKHAGHTTNEMPTLSWFSWRIPAAPADPTNKSSATGRHVPFSGFAAVVALTGTGASPTLRQRGQQCAKGVIQRPHRQHHAAGPVRARPVHQRE